MRHSLLMATEEELEWMIDREGKIWFDWLNGEWRDMPARWIRASNSAIVWELTGGALAGRPRRKLSAAAIRGIIQDRKDEERKYQEYLAHQRRKNKRKYKPRPAPDLNQFLNLAKQIIKPE